MIKLKTLFIMLMAFVVTACEHDPYDTGDGYLSKMTADFGEASFDSQGRAFKFVGDNGRTLEFTSPFGKPDAEHADKVVRSLMYYNITDKKDVVSPYAIIGILTANVIEKSKVKDDSTDPLTVESVWLSENKKYLNLSLKIKTSTPDDENVRHKLGMVYEGSEEGMANLRLIHDDSNIPGNYTVETFLSIRVSSITNLNPQCSAMRVSANTYDGIKTFVVDM